MYPPPPPSYFIQLRAVRAVLPWSVKFSCCALVKMCAQKVADLFIVKGGRQIEKAVVKNIRNVQNKNF